MIAAILDTNVFVQAAVGSPRGASTRVLGAYDAGRYRLILSPATIDEVIEVLLLPDIRSRHGWSDDEILRFVFSFLHSADLYTGQHAVSAAVPRDITDTKLLGLAEKSAADYLVTNDRRHLLRLKTHGLTRIVTPTQFLRALP